MSRPDIGVGDREGLPMQRPIVGRHYRVTSIYGMRYGLGCTLQGLDPFPYRGYFLFVKRGSPSFKKGWYFKKIEAADDEWTETFYELIRSKKHERA